MIEFFSNILGNNKDYNYEISKDGSFFIDIELKNHYPYSSAIIIINTFSNKEKKIAICSKYKWYLNGENIQKEIKGITTNTFQLLIDYIGFKVSCEIISEEDNYPGSAFIKFNTVMPNPILREGVQHILLNEKYNFILDSVTGFEKEKNTQSCNITINKNNFNLNFKNKNENYTFKIDYYEIEPEVESIHGDMFCLKLKLKNINDELSSWRKFLNLSKYNKYWIIYLNFISKNTKDLFVFSLKCFKTIKYINFNQIIFDNINNSKDFLDLSLINDNLRNENLCLYNSILKINNKPIKINSKNEILNSNNSNFKLDTFENDNDNDYYTNKINELKNENNFLKNKLNNLNKSTNNNFHKKSPKNKDESLNFSQMLNDISFIDDDIKKENLKNIKNKKNSIELNQNLQTELENIKHENLYLKEENISLKRKTILNTKEILTVKSPEVPNDYTKIARENKIFRKEIIMLKDTLESFKLSKLSEISSLNKDINTLKETLKSKNNENLAFEKLKETNKNWLLEIVRLNNKN